MEIDLFSMLQVFNKEYDSGKSFFDLLSNVQCRSLLKLVKKYKDDGFQFLIKCIEVPDELNLYKKEPLLIELDTFKELPISYYYDPEDYLTGNNDVIVSKLSTDNYIPYTIENKNYKTDFYCLFIKSYFNAIITYINYLISDNDLVGINQLQKAIDNLYSYLANFYDIKTPQKEHKLLHNYLYICVYYACLEFSTEDKLLLAKKDTDINPPSIPFGKSPSAIKTISFDSPLSDKDEILTKSRLKTILSEIVISNEILKEFKETNIISKSITQSFGNTPPKMIKLLLSTAKQFHNDMFTPSLYKTLTDSDCTRILSQGVRVHKDNPAKFCEATANTLSKLSKSFDPDMINELYQLSKITAQPQTLPPIPKFIDKKSEFFFYLTFNYFTCLISYITDIYNIEKDDDIAYHSLYSIMGSLEDFINKKEYEFGGEKPDVIIKSFFALCLYATHSIISYKMSKHIDFTPLTNAELEFKIIPTYDNPDYDLPTLKSQFDQYKEENPDVFYKKIEINASNNFDKVEPHIEEANSLNTIVGDNRNPKKGVCSYNEIIKKPSSFETFESRLYEYGYIDEQYSFIGKHGQQLELAKIYHILIFKGYFSKIYFDKEKNSRVDISNRHIKKFLNHRYNADIDRQFRNLEKTPEIVSEFMDKNYWLSSLLPC